MNAESENNNNNCQEGEEEEENAMEFVHKLEMINKLKSDCSHLTELKSNLQSEMHVIDKEETCLTEYINEMEQLQQERQEHVEALRLIHADVNLLETTIRQSKEERGISLEKARNMVREYQMLRRQIGVMKDELGLEPMDTGHDDGGRDSIDDKIEKLAEKTIAASWHQSDATTELLAPSIPSTAQYLSLKPDMSSLRQQPPPMKSCLSCHQQIHRNAPICPLCKAKSRSRNPKKPKRKSDF